MPKISIVVPIYNVEKYLRRCVDSILNQTFTDFELILVDDGSPDNCGKICDEYAKVDKRVRVIHKENGGLSDARNCGIGEAIGDYIGFVDSDDYIDPDMYEVLCNDILKNDADVAVCGIYNCYENIVRVECPQEYNLVVDNDEAVKMVLEGKLFSVPACNKLYKKSCFEKIKFPVGKTSEDAFTIPSILSKCKRVSVNTLPKYRYMHRESSISSGMFRKSDLDIIEAYDKNLKMVEKDFPNHIKVAEYRYIWAHAYVLDKTLLTENFTDYKMQNDLIRFLRKRTFKILFNSCFLTSRKLATIVLLFSKKMYKKLLIENRTKTFKLGT